MKTTQVGFTLIELLVSMAIIGILAGVAIPQYSQYKKKAFDTLALSDLRTIALAEEARFIDEDSYLSCKDDECLHLPGVSRITTGVSISVAADDESFVATAKHEKGTGKEFTWDSTYGGVKGH